MVDTGLGCQMEHLYMASPGLPHSIEIRLHEQGSQENKTKGRNISFYHPTSKAIQSQTFYSLEVSCEINLYSKRGKLDPIS